jgi:hypothetical protein
MLIFMSPSLSVTHDRNSEIKQLRPLFFAMLWDIDLIFGMWVYNDKLQIKFTLRSGPMIFGRFMALGLKFGQIYSFHHFFSLCLEILIWCLIYMYELQIKFTFCSGPMIFGQVMARGLWNLAKYLVVTTLFHYVRFEILTWFLAWECIIISYRSILKFICYSYLITEGIKKGWNICEPP